MATATEIATKALKRINVIASGETPAAADLIDATDALNAMIAAWEIDGLSGDVLPIDARFEQGVTALLAMRLAEDYGKTAGPILQRDAANGWAGLQAAFFAVPQSSFDRALKWTGNYTDYGFFLGNEIETNSRWFTGTDYQLRDTVTNLGNIYECTTAGTSGAGPTGTGDNITDGTVVWIWRRVDGSRNIGLVAQ
jgi:hypothetical protein